MRLDHCIENLLNATPQHLSDLRLNRLLAALPDADRAQWQPYLEAVDLRAGQVLSESGATSAHAYFPTTAIVSLLYVMEEGASAEIAVVGLEGIVGISLFMGGETTSSRAVVQSAGAGFRLKAHLLMAEFNRGGPVLHLLLRSRFVTLCRSRPIHWDSHSDCNFIRCELYCPRTSRERCAKSRLPDIRKSRLRDFTRRLRRSLSRQWIPQGCAASARIIPWRCCSLRWIPFSITQSSWDCSMSYALRRRSKTLRG